MTEKVLTIDKCEELVALGLDMSDAGCVWFNFLERGWTINPLNDGKENITVAQLKKYHGDENVIPTYTLQDILKRLWVPIEIIDPLETYNSEIYEFRMGSALLDNEGHYEIFMRYIGDCHILHEVRGKSENILELAYDMLKWRILNESDLRDF